MFKTFKFRLEHDKIMSSISFVKTKMITSLIVSLFLVVILLCRVVNQPSSTYRLVVFEMNKFWFVYKIICDRLLFLFLVYLVFCSIRFYWSCLRIILEFCFKYLKRLWFWPLKVSRMFFCNHNIVIFNSTWNKFSIRLPF